MSGWADRLMAYDVESGGLSVTDDRIITACVVHIQPGQTPDVHTWLIAPDVDIAPEAEAVHGISTAYAREHGRPAADVLTEIGDEIRRGWAAGETLAAHNASYDLSITTHETYRWLHREFPIMGPVVCSLTLDRATDRYRKGSRKLPAVAEHHQVKQTDLHSAQGDALAAARIAWRINRAFPEVAAMTPDELWTYQRQAHREWAEHFQSYRRRKLHDEGATVEEIEAFVIPTDWPITHPLPTAATTEGTHP